MAEVTQKITLVLDDGTEIEMEVVESTRVAGVNYLLVADADDTALLLKDTAPEDSEEAAYEIVEDEKELKYVMAIFAELLEDIDIE